MSSVVRKLSPFSQNPTMVKEQKDSENSADSESNPEAEKKKLFKEAVSK